MTDWPRKGPHRPEQDILHMLEHTEIKYHIKLKEHEGRCWKTRSEQRMMERLMLTGVSGGDLRWRDDKEGGSW